MSNSYKQVSIISIVSLFSFWFWVLARPWIENPYRLSVVQVWLAPLIALIVLTSLIGVALVVLRGFWPKFILGTGIAFTFLLVFGFALLYLSAIAIMGLLLAYANRLLRNEKNARIQIDTQSIFSSGLRLVVMPLLVMISFAYYLSPDVQAVGTQEQLPATFRKVIEVTVDGFLGGKLDEVPVQQRTQTKTKIVNEVFRDISQIIKPYFQYLPPVLAFGLFAILFGSSYIFFWLSVFLAMLIFKILRAVGFVGVTQKTVTAEEIITI